MHAVHDEYLARLGRIATGCVRSELSDRAIHRLRRDIKAARAILRLLRPGLGEAEYRRQNRILRDAGRQMTPARDSRAQLDTLDQLLRRIAIDECSKGCASLRAVLQRRHRQACRRLTPARLRRHASRIREVRRRTRAIGQQQLSRADCEQALRAALRRARRAWRAACRVASAAQLHEWRKELKRCISQLRFAIPEPGRRGRRWLATAARLAQALGEDRDLYLLQQTALRLEPDANRLMAGALLLAELEAMRQSLQRKAFKLGDELLHSKPRQVLRSIL